jgi:hypothetical protein
MPQTVGTGWLSCSGARLDPCSCGGSTCDPRDPRDPHALCVACGDGPVTITAIALQNVNNTGHSGSFDNGLTGTIPWSMGSLTSLDFLDLGNNHGLTGTIPSRLGSLMGLTWLGLYNLGPRGLTGTIPSSLGSLTRLTNLALAASSLTGTTPSSLASLTSLTAIGLWRNQLTGTVLPLPFAQYTKGGGCALSDSDGEFSHFRCPLPPNSNKCINYNPPPRKWALIAIDSTPAGDAGCPCKGARARAK